MCPITIKHKSCVIFAEPAPVTSLVTQSATTTSLTVKWTAPEGGWTGYKVTLDGATEKTPGKDDTSVEYVGLTVATQYTVKVVTVSVGTETAEATGQFYTSKL